MSLRRSTPVRMARRAGDVISSVPSDLGAAQRITARVKGLAVHPWMVPGGGSVVPPSSLANTGGGTGLIYAGAAHDLASLRTLQADPAPSKGGAAVSTDIGTQTVKIGNSLVGSNLGPGQGIYSDKTSDATLRFRSLLAGTSITITQVGGGLVIDAPNPPAPVDEWLYIHDTNALKISVAPNLAFPGADIPACWVFPGSSSEATPPPFGGSTFIFDPSVGAFRAGNVSGSDWVQALRGAASAAFGFNTRATGLGSFALGSSSIASGDAGAVVLGGTSNTASGQSSGVLCGSGNTVGILAPSSAILAGVDNTITTAFTSGIVAGASNSVASPDSAVVAGVTNVILAGSEASAILCGNANQIGASAARGVIAAGASNALLPGGIDSGVLCGNNNKVSAGNSAIASGDANKILAGAAQVAIVCGSQITVGAASANSAVLCGNNSSLNASSSSIVNGTGAPFAPASSCVLTILGFTPPAQAETAFMKRLFTNGGLQTPPVTVATNAVLGLDSFVVLLAGFLAFTVLLPAAPVNGQLYLLRKIQGGTTTIGGNGFTITRADSTVVSSYALTLGQLSAVVWDSTAASWVELWV